MKKVPQAVIAASVLLLIGGTIGWFLRKGDEKQVTVQTKLLRENSSSYKFVNPIVLAQTPENTSIPELQTLKKTLGDYIVKAKDENKLEDGSVYFRQLNTDSWIGVNVDDTYAPASMLKALSLIAYLRSAQENPALYSTSITISNEDVNLHANQDYYPPISPVQQGKRYSSNELLSHMIINSDNTAANAINRLMGDEALDKTFTDLNLPVLTETTPSDFISPRQYSRVFRSLYNGAYLSPEVSEQALELLSKTTFTEGIVAGVPEGTVVSHKFGERTLMSTNGQIKELHDCGIIYAPNDPYLLCVMTKGTDFPALQKTISDISRLAWQSVKELDIKK